MLSSAMKEELSTNGYSPSVLYRSAPSIKRDESTVELLSPTIILSEDFRRASTPSALEQTPRSPSTSDDIELGESACEPARRNNNLYVQWRSSFVAFASSERVSQCIRAALLVFWLCYLVAAVQMRRASPTALLTMTGVVLAIVGGRWAWPFYRRALDKFDFAFVNGQRVFFLATCLVGLGIGSWLLVELIRRPEAITSLVGFALIVTFMFLASHHPHAIRWRPVVGGLLLQLLLGALVIKWDAGAKAFQAVGEMVAGLFELAESGVVFVFGAQLSAFNTFAFAILPLIIFFSSFISVLYHFGVMQAVVETLGALLQFLLGTSAAESVCVAANIFVGQTEAPLLIRPLLKDMSLSEIHAVMTGGFATIAGTVLGMYISQGIPAAHLIAASVMAAPGALAASKLLYPETKQLGYCGAAPIRMPAADTSSVVDAISQGASTAIGLVACIGANLVAFIGALSLVNCILAYLGARVGLDNLSFEMICGALFMPVAFLLGIPWTMCGTAGELIGTKLFINEFVAYAHLSEHLISGALDQRSATILTYALCGFANISSIGIQVGGISALVPSRRKDLAQLAVRALIAGTLTNFMTACLAGILFDPSEHEIPLLTNSTMTVTPLSDASVGL